MAGRDWYCEDVFTGKTKVNVIYEDDLVMAFHHPFPNPRWTLDTAIIPKRHIESVLSPEAMDAELLAALINAIKKVTEITGVDKNGKGFEVAFYTASPGVTPHWHWHLRAPILPGK